MRPRMSLGLRGTCSRHRAELKGDSHQTWRTQRVQVNVACLRLFLRSSTGPNRALEPQSLGRVRDPVRIAEGPTAIDAATQRRHFGFRLRLVDKLQPIAGAWQRPRREDGKRRVFALHTAQTRPTLSGDTNSDPLPPVLIPTPIMPSCYRLSTPLSGSFLVFTSVSRWVCSGSTF